ncbi:MAG: molybdopterin-dependent oxidoreductase [Anaerolineae bacterium]|nr:molybdopterin-dependent oxidoreductase [Anaerolineae bacterium]
MTNLTRRDFLKISAAGTATAVLAGCQSSERWVTLEPYVRAPEEQLAGVANWYASTCRLCPAGCGIVVRVMNGRAVKIEGNPEHPVNRGKLCARGQAGLQLLYNPDRIPQAVRQAKRGERKFEPAHWNEAINTLYEKVNGAGSKVAVWVGSSTSGHLIDLFHRFTETLGAPAPIRYDLYAGFHGYHALASANEALFNRAELPVYDLGQADAIFSFGADFLGTWLSATAYNFDYGRFRSQSFGKRGLLVQFEPRMSITGAAADRWVPVQPGAETLVAQAIARLIADEEFGTPERVERAAALAVEVDIEAAAAACELSVENLAALARVFATAEHPVAIPGGALAGRNSAAEAIAAIQALNIIAGTMGEPGGMALPAALPVENLVPPANSSFADVQDMIEQMRSGEIEVLLVHGANPAYDLPEAAGFMDAIKNVPFVASFSPLVDETAAWADLILPDRVYLEGWGYEVVAPSVGGLPVISSQQPVVPPFRDARATADVLLTISKGIPAAAQALPWEDEVAYIKAIITGLPDGAAGGQDDEVRWARFLQFGGWWPVSPPETPAPEATVSEPIEVAPVQFQGDEDTYPYFLYPYMSVLLGDGRGASLPWLQGAPDPMTTISWQTWVELNPETARKLEVENSDIVRVTSPHGTIEVPVYIFPAIRPDTVAIPIGQGHTDSGRYARERGANALGLIGDDLAWSTVRVKIEKTGDRKSLAVFESTIEAPEQIHSPV